MSWCCCSRDSGVAVRKINLSEILDQEWSGLFFNGCVCSCVWLSLFFLYTLISLYLLYFIIFSFSVSSTTYLTVCPQPLSRAVCCCWGNITVRSESPWTALCTFSQRTCTSLAGINIPAAQLDDKDKWRCDSQTAEWHRGQIKKYPVFKRSPLLEI